MNFAEIIVMDNAIAECNTPKNMSTAIGDKIKFATKTPVTIPKKYFLLNTIKGLKLSETRNWMSRNTKGVMRIETETYKAAITTLTTSVILFKYDMLLHFFTYEL